MPRGLHQGVAFDAGAVEGEVGNRLGAFVERERTVDAFWKSKAETVPPAPTSYESQTMVCEACARMDGDRCE